MQTLLTRKYFCTCRPILPSPWPDTTDTVITSAEEHVLLQRVYPPTARHPNTIRIRPQGRVQNMHRRHRMAARQEARGNERPTLLLCHAIQEKGPSSFDGHAECLKQLARQLPAVTKAVPEQRLARELPTWSPSVIKKSPSRSIPLRQLACRLPRRARARVHPLS